MSWFRRLSWLSLSLKTWKELSGFGNDLAENEKEYDVRWEKCDVS